MAEQAGRKKGVMDVSKPGRTAPSASSRPVLLSHKPVLQDPMFNSSQTEKVEEKKQEQKTDMSSGGAPTPQSKQQPETPAQNPVPEPKAPQHPPAPQPTSGEVPATAAASPAAAQAQPKQEPGNETKPGPDVKQLVHDKTYFMPVTQPPKGQGLYWILAALAIVVVAAIIYLLLMTPS